MTKRGAALTIYDIARSANVSPKTVSRVINRNPQVGAELRERVNKAIAELGYEPNHAARTLKGPRGYTLAMLVTPELVALPLDDEWFLVPYIGTLEAVALRTAQVYGYRFLSEGIRSDAEGIADDLLRYQRRQIDGVVVLPPHCDNPRVMEALAAARMPAVRLSPGTATEHGTTLSIDERGAAREATEHLIGLGHRRIAMIAGPPEHAAAAKRIDGFRDAMAAVPDAWTPPIAFGDFMPDSAYRIATAWLKGPDRPSAIFAANDAMGAGAIAAAIDLGLRLPHDLSVVGFDDVDGAKFTWPPLTTVRQPFGLMARHSIELLTALVDGRAEGDAHIQLPCRLVIRRSTAAPGR